MEASALELRRGTAQGKGVLNGSLLRLRSDEQLVELFRAGEEEAFRVIHDRYRKRLLAYMTQMLGGSAADAEDGLQDVFERAYAGLRAHDRELALRAWLYRVAHNRCVDQLRRPAPVAVLDPDETESRDLDPYTVTQRREILRRLIIDIGRLPDHQRSALLLREMSGLSYAELGGALGVSVPAVKSLLVRARVGLVAAGEARDTACSVIREQLVAAHDSGTRPDATVRRHLRDCAQCRHFRRSMRSVSRNLAAVTPIVGPVGLLVKLLGGGGAASGGVAGSGGGAAVGGGSLVTAGGAIGTTGALTGGVAAGGAGHVAAIVAAALVTAGGAVAVQPSAPGLRHPVRSSAPVPASTAARPSTGSGSGTAVGGGTASSPAAPRGAAPARGASRPGRAHGAHSVSPQGHPAGAARSSTTPPVAAGAPATGSDPALLGASPSSSTGSTSSTASDGSSAPPGSSGGSGGSTVADPGPTGSTASPAGGTGTGTGGATSATPSSSASPPSSSTGSTSNG